jgi:Ca-activated chloride channel family protein
MFDWLTNFTLLRPLWLPALLPGAALWWFLRRNRDPRRLYGRQIAPHLLKHLVIGESKRGLFQPMRIFSLVWLLLVIALAGPSWRMEPAPFAEQQAGLMVLLKTGSSMKALDLPPSRLERAVHKLHDLFVPFITALIALWARRGWSLQWP